jgi:hypothetical protein
MNQRTISGVGDKPLPGEALLQGDSLNGADMITEATAFAGDRVNPEVFYRIEVAQLGAQATLGALLSVNNRYLPAPEVMLLLNSRLKQQVKVGGIHIAISQYLAFSQGGE